MFNSSPFEVFFVGFLGLIALRISLRAIGGNEKENGTRLMSQNFNWTPFPTIPIGNQASDFGIEEIEEKK